MGHSLSLYFGQPDPGGGDSHMKQTGMLFVTPKGDQSGLGVA